jgi:hypothetical protein
MAVAQAQHPVAEITKLLRANIDRSASPSTRSPAASPAT